MGKDVIVACDFNTAEETLSFLDNFTEEKPYVKIGMELFYAEGPQIVRDILPPRAQELTAVSKYVLCCDKTAYRHGFEYWNET